MEGLFLPSNYLIQGSILEFVSYQFSSLDYLYHHQDKNYQILSPIQLFGVAKLQIGLILLTFCYKHQLPFPFMLFELHFPEEFYFDILQRILKFPSAAFPLFFLYQPTHFPFPSMKITFI
jgi:hypothetical protein